MLTWLRNRIEAGLNTAEDHRNTSRHWFLVCTNCGHKRSYFALGGTRHKAAGQGKSLRTFCTSCQSSQRFITQWFNDPDPEDDGKAPGWVRVTRP